MYPLVIFHNFPKLIYRHILFEIYKRGERLVFQPGLIGLVYLFYLDSQGIYNFAMF